MDFTELDFDTEPNFPWFVYPVPGTYEWHFGGKSGALRVDEPGTYTVTMDSDGNVSLQRLGC